MFALKQYSSRIGPAVLYGGLSTMLATVLLAFSDYYLFTAFFKVSHHISSLTFVDLFLCIFCIFWLLAVFKEKGKERRFIFFRFS